MSSSVLLTTPGPLAQLLSCESFYGEACKSPDVATVATIKRGFGVLTNPRLPVKKTAKTREGHVLIRHQLRFAALHAKIDI